MGKILILLGLLLVLLGLVLSLVEHLPLGHLPGDFVIRRGNWTIYIPLATSLLLSVLLTLLLNLLFRR